ncbi:uracil-DNA glycosylase [Robiginitalea sp. M366]|uniref:uracil-DNA glycosylase n=1 Tax=Robiginitalea aestuariiviva TaxID=3036903 RepID=UPI00240E5736|nr:uracil-DNA glycosylase [Robiginitalea aestuariiviva]MDG1572885.1 uracil-DNA glycosylase [Robiginitalea aestuariiviva]
MKVQMAPAWQELLQPEFDKPYFHDLTTFVREEYRNHTCFPPGPEIFAAFSHCTPKALKAVIIGQDPYHGPGQAHGLCFSVRDGNAHPPSLINIFKEIQANTGAGYPESGDLSRWAKQGVLLLNATLTVRAHQAGSHQKKGWETFTDAVIQRVSASQEGLVFLLWGGYAKRKSVLIDREKHRVLTSGHPSPLSANRGLWFGNGHFTQANAFLERQGKTPIIW